MDERKGFQALLFGLAAKFGVAVVLALIEKFTGAPAKIPAAAPETAPAPDPTF